MDFSHFLSSYAGLDCIICWYIIKLLIALQNLFLLKLFGIGNYLSLIYLSTGRVWSNLSLTSKNLAHRLIHFKVIHRAYITPYKRFKMKLQSSFNCHICNTASAGTFLHMFSECPIVISLWTHVNLVLSSLLRIDWSVNPSLCLLNDDSGLCISSMQKRMFYSCEEDNNTELVYTAHVWKNILEP